MRRFIGFAALLLMLVACGGVDVQNGAQDPLKVLSLSPRAGETGVALDAEVVVVFSDQVSIGEGEASLNGDTLYVQTSAGQVLTATIEASALDPDSTMILVGLSLTADTEYQIVVAGSLTGSNSQALSAEVRSSFRTVAP